MTPEEAVLIKWCVPCNLFLFTVLTNGFDWLIALTPRWTAAWLF
jgi:hypothetical protein